LADLTMAFWPLPAGYRVRDIPAIVGAVRDATSSIIG
jgi:hypothetical protein